MGQNFRDCDREQAFLLPPSLRDWLPEDHLAWFVIATVSQLDLDAFYAAYRADGKGRPAYDPAVMVSLLTYAFATGEFSSRGIERHCRQDIAYRVITANEVPDHATIVRFVHRHQDALAGLFTAVLELCGKAGLVRAGIVVFDGTKLSGNAHRDRNLDYGQIAREIIEQAIETDAAEDEEHGDARGDELPEELSTDEGRRAWLARELAARAQTDDPAEESPAPEPFDPNLIVARGQGRDGWIRESRRRLDDQRTGAPSPVPRSRDERLWNAGQRLTDDLDAIRRGQQAWEQWRQTATDKSGRRMPKRTLRQPPDSPDATINLTDPDTQMMMGHKQFIQGYNAQAVVTEDQIVLAAEISTRPGDFSQLRPMLTTTCQELEQAAITQRPQIALADAGFWNEEHMDALAADGVTVLIPPDAGNRRGERPGWTGGRYSWMRQILKTDAGMELYRKRRITIEPVFGQTKHNRKFTQFHKRGRGAVRTESRLLMMTHNLAKLHRHHLATQAA
jgi:transposase